MSEQGRVGKSLEEILRARSSCISDNASGSTLMWLREILSELRQPRHWMIYSFICIRRLLAIENSSSLVAMNRSSGRDFMILLSSFKIFRLWRVAICGGTSYSLLPERSRTCRDC